LLLKHISENQSINPESQKIKNIGGKRARVRSKGPVPSHKTFEWAVSYTTVQCRIRKYFRASWLGPLGTRAPLHCRVCRGGSYATGYHQISQCSFL